MADTGSSVTAADCKKEFPDATILESKAQKAGIQYTAADGSKIPNEGQVRLVHVTPEGATVTFMVQNAKVALPILSIRKLASRDAVATFWHGGGKVVMSSGIEIPIVERQGIYFIALNIQGLPDNQHSSFQRPELP